MRGGPRRRWTLRSLHSTITGAVCAGLLMALDSGVGAQDDPEERAETQSIERVIREYREAVETLDAKRVKSVWPSANEKALAKAFAEIEQQSLSFDACVIGRDESHAEATCTGNARIVPRVGNPAPHYVIGEWRFTLRKTDAAWAIRSVEARSN